jgi:hypothetical protein
MEENRLKVPEEPTMSVRNNLRLVAVFALALLPLLAGA